MIAAEHRHPQELARRVVPVGDSWSTAGGNVVVEGTPDHIASYTGRLLALVLGNTQAALQEARDAADLTAVSTRLAPARAPDPSAPIEAPERRSTGDGVRRPGDGERALAVVLLALFTLVFVVQAAPRIAAPFGDSHDGRNGATWALASRAIRDDGWFESAGGGRLGADQGPYAHHPPLIASETAVVEMVAGEHEWAARLPAWIGAIASIGLLYALLRRRALRPLAACVGTIVALSCPMFLLYGTMLDTIQIALPFALALLFVREGRGVRTEAWCALLAAVCVLASWEGTLLCVVLVGVDLVRRRRMASMPVSGTLLGAAIGLVLLGGWLLWVSGSFGPMLEQLAIRSGSRRSVGWWEYLEIQRTYLGSLVTPVAAVLGLVGIALATMDARTRELALVLSVTTIGYAVLLRDGSFHHDYWNFWIVLPIAVGAAVAVDRFLRACEARSLHVPATAGCVAVAVLAVALGVGSQTFSRYQFDSGRAAGELARDAARSHAGGPVALAGTFTAPARWDAYYAGRAPVLLTTPTRAEMFASTHPRAIVLVNCRTPRRWLGAACAANTSGYALVRADELRADR